MAINTDEFKKKLEEELVTVTKELESVGRRNPDNPADWEATAGNLDILESDRNEAADRIEEYETNTGILKELETRFNNIKDALKRIEDGTFGICSVDGEEIELERLRANPAATTCLKHLEEEA